MSSSIFIITDFKIIFEIDNNGDNMKRFIEKVIKQGTKYIKNLRKTVLS